MTDTTTILFRFIIAFIIIMLAFWVFRCIGQSYILKAYGRRCRFLVWIPVAGPMFFNHGLRDEDNKIRVFGAGVPAWIPSLYVIWGFILMFIPYAGMFLCIACCGIFYGAVCARVYADFYCGMERNTGIAVLGYISGFITIIATVHFFVLMCRGWRPDTQLRGIPAKKAARQAGQRKDTE